MEEILYKFIDEGRRKHDDMRAFICEFRTTNEILFKERNNSLSELRFEVQELLRVIDNTSMSNCEIKGVTTRGTKATGSLSPKIKKRKRRGSAEKVLRIPEATPHQFAFHRSTSSNAEYAKFLKDLGASISLMPYTMYEKLGLGEPKATRMSLELADRSIQYPRGIIENVLIKVDKFVLPIDFIILDMSEDSRVPIILGRPFLATARAMIDVFNKKITLRVGDDEVIFDVDQSIKKPPADDDECYGVDDLDETINAEAQELLANDKSDSFLLKGLEKSIDQSDLESCKSVSDSNSEEPIRRIDSVNTPYPVVQETTKPDEVKSEHLYSASANEIDEKKLELKFFASTLRIRIPAR
ncbi:DNA-directed DNA polymerase [Tanacetum coccineum]